MKETECTLFSEPSKREKKRDTKRLKKALKKQRKAINKSEVILAESSVADMLVILGNVRTNIDSLITHLAGIR